MTVKEELHHLVDRMSDDRAREAIGVLRGLVQPGEAFFSAPRLDLETLAREQGVGPVTDPNVLVGDFWPDDETIDDFLEAVRNWRREGDNG